MGIPFGAVPAPAPAPAFPDPEAVAPTVEGLVPVAPPARFTLEGAVAVAGADDPKPEKVGFSGVATGAPDRPIFADEELLADELLVPADPLAPAPPPPAPPPPPP